MTDSPRRLLIVVTTSPYGNNRGRDALDLVLTAAAFGCAVSVLFRGDGVYQLLDDQQTDASGIKNLANNLKALPIYEVDQLFVDRLALEQRDLSDAALLLATAPLDDDQLAALYARHDQVLSF